MTYKEFKKILLDLDLSISEFAKIFELNRGSITNMRAKGKVSKTIRNYVLLVQGIGVEKMKELIGNK